MEFLIADTFTDSLARLTGEEQKAVKTTSFDLQLNPANPGLQMHKLDRARDPRFWSVRVNSDIRIIIHRSDNRLLLCYTDHHDKAYDWAVRRKLEVHPSTGAAQLVEIREAVREITVPRYVERHVEEPRRYLFSNVSDDALLSYGVPRDWLSQVREADEDYLLELAEHLPAEAAEALLNLAVGITPEITPVAGGTDPFTHPDAQRRFRVMNNYEELERALEFPWEKWTVFLHPVQRQLVEKEYNGPARVSGSAGTGKTIVALHRAVHLARTNPDTRVLLTTFSDTLANSLRTKLKRLISNEPRIGERIDIHTLNSLGLRLYELSFGRPKIASRESIESIVSEAVKSIKGHKFSKHFLVTEWEEVVDAWQLKSWEDYRNVLRLGRKTRLNESQRQILWRLMDKVRLGLQSQGLITYSDLFCKLADKLAAGKHSPYDFAVIDEAQDVNIGQLRFLAALGVGRPNSLFFTGDLGQRVFQQPFSWKALGIDIRGRSKTLRINYRTSHQIRMRADRLLGQELSDVDGNKEDRRCTISVFNGPNPEVLVLDDVDNEIETVSKWLKKRSQNGVKLHEIGIFVRTSEQLNRPCQAVKDAGLQFKILDENVETTHGYVSISTMHLAKGLEFRAVVVMACDDEIIPLQERIENVSDDADLEEVYNTERHLLYVACTRARDYLLVTSVDPASEFLDDMVLR